MPTLFNQPVLLFTCREASKKQKGERQKAQIKAKVKCIKFLPAGPKADHLVTKYLKLYKPRVHQIFRIEETGGRDRPTSIGPAKIPL